MEYGGVIGHVLAKGGGRWDWFVPEFSKLPERRKAFFDSPDFDAEGETWRLRIEPNGSMFDTQMRIALDRASFRNRKSISCTVALKRKDLSEETIGTYTPNDYSVPVHIGTMCDLCNLKCLPDGHLTLTLHFGGALVSQANIKGESRATQTDVLDVKIGKKRRHENCTCIEAKGVTLLSENVKGLLTEENKNYDVRIFVKGQEFRAHRLILEARSPVLGMMLTHDSKEKNSGTIHIEDCDPDCFDAFLLFVYCGRAENLTASKALGLYYAADKYDLPDLKEQCVHFLEASLSATSVCHVVQLAAKHGEDELLRTATEFFEKNIKQIVLTVEWQNFMTGNFKVATGLLIKAFEKQGY